MKKRLSEDTWTVRCLCLCFFVLFAIYGFAMRATTMGSRYGHIGMDVPVASLPVDDPRYAEGDRKPSQILDGKTSMVVLTSTAYYFGEMNAFSGNFSDVRNKFIVPHVEGAPDTPKLVETMGRWLSDKKVPLTEKNPVIFLPTAEVPASIVIQVSQQLKASPLFNRVILGTGLL